MIDLVKKLIRKENFNPKIIGLFTNPFYFARKGLYIHISELIVCLNGKLLDIGCGRKPYQALAHNVTEYVGLEIDDEGQRVHEFADYLYDGNKMPFDDNAFDSIFCSQVFEHVFNPEEFIKEVRRVLKTDGQLLLTVPFVWDEHEQPYDYARYSSYGLVHFLKKEGFEIIQQRKSTPNIATIFQLINAYIYKVTVTNNKFINVITTFLLMSPFNILGFLLSKITPKNEDLYLDNIILVKKTND